LTDGHVDDATARQHLEQHDGECPQVAALVDGAIGSDLDIRGLQIAGEHRYSLGIRCLSSTLGGPALSRGAGYNVGMSGQVATPKAQMIELIDKQPDDSSYDELLRELAFARMVDRGLADADAGRTVSHDTMKRTIESWRK
jgi:hypothetical protein